MLPAAWKQVLVNRLYLFSICSYDNDYDDGRGEVMETIVQTQAATNESSSQIVLRLRENFHTGLTRSAAYRQEQLTGLLRFLTECETDIMAALRADLGKSAAESFATEIGFTAAEVKLTLKNLAAWMRPKKVPTGLLVQPGKSYIYPEPLGVVLIIGPWNYPIQLCLSPLIGALAAGNCVVLKPSELAPACSKLLCRELPQYIDSKCLSVMEGGVAETTALLEQQFDHIFYTGNGRVGRIVMTAAAKNLTPVTLELGGKSPCIVDASADLDAAARRIVWGKFTNAGQTCVAPDYVLADATIENALLDKMRIAALDFFGSNPKASPDYGRIVNVHHYKRLFTLLNGSGDVFIGGKGDESECYFAPTILRHVMPDAPVMADEIFGPILPVIAVKNMDDAVAFVNARPKPLALYLFSSSKSVQDRVIAATSSGSVCVNHVMLQIAVPSLPFGGVGASGMGVYHGKSTFDTFTHFKSVLTKPTWFDPSLLYPPYKSTFMKLIRWIM